MSTSLAEKDGFFYVALSGLSSSFSPRDGINVGPPPAPTSPANTLIMHNTVRHSGHDGIYNAGFGTTLVKNITNHNGHDGIYNQQSPTFPGSGVTLASNTVNFNTNLGIETVPGATDGGGNRAHGNGNPLQCTNIVCGP